MRYALVTVVSTLTSSNPSFPVDPRAVGTARAQLWASTSGAGGATSVSSSTGGGSGGGGYSEEPAFGITPGGTLAIVIPPGGNGGNGAAGVSGNNPGDSTITGPGGVVTAHPGLPGTCATGSGPLGAGAPASTNTIAFGGGNASSGASSSHAGSGGGSAGSQGAGGNASGTTGGTAGTPDGAAGQNGPTLNGPGIAGASPGGGAAGARGGATHQGGQGGTGQAIITYTIVVQLGATPNVGRPSLRRGGSRGSMGAPYTAPPPPVISPFYQPTQAQRGAKLLRRGGSTRGNGAPYTAPGPVHVPPFHQPQQPHRGARLLRGGRSRGGKGSPVKPFPAQVVNQWVGTVAQSPVWGSSLPGTASCVIDLTAASSVGGGSGIPTQGNWLFVVAGWNAGAGVATINVGDDTSQWWRPAPPSSAAGGSRTVIWYQPNIAAPTTVYVAPSAYIDGMTVTVLEVGGLGPWDTVTGTSYGSVAGVAMGMSLPAPGAPTFMIAAVTGDSVAAGTGLTASGFTPLATVTATNGTDTTGDTVLLSAAISTSAAQTVTGTASSSENLSGMMIGVLQHGPSPVPAGINPNWPYLICEAAFGSGYMTPPDQMVWTDLANGAPNGTRLRGWHESTGVQYELDALESAELELVLDNPDGALTPFNAASPWFPHVVPGTPIRIRAVTPAADRWYVIQRNIERWPQSWDENLRGLANAVGTDLWSVVNRDLATCYRAEVLNDLNTAGGWWWPCDDGPVNNPTSLVNASPGSSVPLQITTAPGGLTSSILIPVGSATQVFLMSAIQEFAADGGWMFGDSASAAWSQTGTGSVSTGRYLTATDTFPDMATGASVEGWWNFTFQNTIPPNPNLTSSGPPGQPSGTIVLWSADGPGGQLAQLALDSTGHLVFTVGGATTTVWSGSDLRNTTWFGATATIGGGKWAVWLNGGVVAHVTGTTSVTGAWTTFTANATAGGLSGIGNPKVAHLAIYPEVLPAPRVIAHFTAAYTAFGQMPQPTGLTQVFIPSTAYAPDGNRHTGTFFTSPFSFGGGDSTLAAYVNSSGGAATSGPVIPESWSYCVTTDKEPGAYAWLTATSPAVPTFSWYTAAGSGNEQLDGTSVENYRFVNSYGSGAAVPSAPSPLGDTVGNRIERVLQSGNVLTPARCIDAAPAAVVAELDTGGQAAGSALANMESSDSGLLFINNVANLCYFSRPRLAAMPVAWQFGTNVTAGQIPYEADDLTLDTDPQRVANDIQVTQFDVAGVGSGGGSGSGETHGGLVFGPSASRYPAVLASQLQNGAQKLQNGDTSYLQSQALIQSQVNWLFDEFGNPAQRITNLTVKAEAQAPTCPQAWLFILGANVGDVIQAYITLPGQPPSSGIWRITKITRSIRFGIGETEASVSIIADVYTSYWS